MRVKVITLQQPYAHYCIHGDSIAEFGRTVDPDIKDIENRNWPCSYTGRLYIHAGKSWYIDAEDRRWMKEAYPDIYKAMEAEMGHIIGHVEMTGCIMYGTPGCRSPWFFGPYGFQFRNAMPIKPVPARGSLGLWNHDLVTLAEIEELHQVAERHVKDMGYC